MFWLKIWEFLLKIFSPIANKFWWPVWSNIRWKNIDKSYIWIEDEDKVSTISQARLLVKRLYEKFKWTKDGANQLWDSIIPPSEAYLRYKSGILKDDCDGFHSLVYHCLSNSNIRAYLLSVISAEGSHCVLLFKLENKWYINDYYTIYKGYNNPEEAITAYNKKYKEIYEHKLSVIKNYLIQYDYQSWKFKSVKMKKVK